MLWALTLALSVEQQQQQQRVSLAVDAAGDLTRENLRVEQKTGTWCQNTNFRDTTGSAPGDNMLKKGCGMCASSCVKHDLTVMAAADANDTITNYGAVMACYTKCKDTQCTAMSVDSANKNCVMHYSMPVGALCGSAAKEENGGYYGCRVNPENTGDTVAEARMASCADQACYINEEMYQADSEVMRLGHGSCHRDEGSMIIITDTIIGGAPSPDGLAPGNPKWPPEDKVTSCSNDCKADATCRAFNFGKRYKSSGGTINYNGAGEYFCQTFSTTPSYASRNPNDAHEMSCAAYSGTATAFSGQIGISNHGECSYVTPICYVRTTRETAVPVARGSGLCAMDNGNLAPEMAQLDPGSGQTYTAAQCQAECAARGSSCVGGASGACTGTGCASAAASSFCDLYTTCSGSSCSSGGQTVTSASKELLAEHMCATECGATYSADGVLSTPPTPCTCLNQGPNGQGYQGPQGDATWADIATTKFQCCAAGSACRTCLDDFSSECFSVSRV